VPKVAYEQMGEVLASVHVLLLPSRVEAAPRVIAEAVCCGTPVITRSLPWLREEWGDSDAVLFVEDEREAVAAVERLYHESVAEPEKYRARRSRAVERGREYELEKVAGRFEAMLFEVVARKAGSGLRPSPAGVAGGRGSSSGASRWPG
jgi:glycosyltransferase involved in cell wall biosynthesis